MNNVHILAHMHARPSGCVRAWEGPKGAGGRRMVCVRQDKHYNTTYTPTWLGWEGLAGCPSIMYSALDTIGPVGRSQRSRREHA